MSEPYIKQLWSSIPKKWNIERWNWKIIIQKIQNKKIPIKKMKVTTKIKIN